MNPSVNPSVNGPVQFLSVKSRTSVSDPGAPLRSTSRASGSLGATSRSPSIPPGRPTPSRWRARRAAWRRPASCMACGTGWRPRSPNRLRPCPPMGRSLSRSVPCQNTQTIPRVPVWGNVPRHIPSELPCCCPEALEGLFILLLIPLPPTPHSLMCFIFICGL